MLQNLVAMPVTFDPSNANYVLIHTDMVHYLCSTIRIFWPVFYICVYYFRLYVCQVVRYRHRDLSRLLFPFRTVFLYFAIFFRFRRIYIVSRSNVSPCFRCKCEIYRDNVVDTLENRCPKIFTRHRSLLSVTVNLWIASISSFWYCSRRVTRDRCSLEKTSSISTRRVERSAELREIADDSRRVDILLASSKIIKYIFELEGNVRVIIEIISVDSFQLTYEFGCIF